MHHASNSIFQNLDRRQNSLIRTATIIFKPKYFFKLLCSRASPRAVFEG